MRFNLNRNITIKASQKKVQNLVLDFKHWSSWSPWTITEPDCKIKVTGNTGTTGHQMTWDGDIIGSGKNTLIQVSDKQLDYNLEFLKPWKSTAKVSFHFKSMGKQTKVTWSMKGNMPIFMFFMIPTMKGWISMDYDRGLRMLKALAEEGKIKAKTTNKGTTDISGFSYVGLQKTVAIDGIGPAMQNDFDKIIKDVVIKHKKSAQNWVTLYPKFNMGKMTMTYIAAVSDEELKDIDLGPEYVTGTVPATKALEIHHAGSYNFLGNAWSMGMMYLRAKKIKQKPVPFEQYWNSPKEVAPEKLKTSIFFPLK